MLIVLSEIDCRKFLGKMGIYPDEFYTDFTIFKNRTSSFREADIIVIFAGSCRFSKRHILETIKVLKKRAYDGFDTGVKSLTVFSDVVLPTLECYYKFDNNLFQVSKYSGEKLKEKDSEIWGNLPKGERGGMCYLTSFDSGDVEVFCEAYKNLFSTDNSYRNLIKKPDFKNIEEI